MKFTGTCQPEKCGGFCCKTFHQDKEGNLTFAHLCKFQNKDGLCQLQKENKKPEYCKQWPKIPHKFFKLCQEHGCTLDFTEK